MNDSMNEDDSARPLSAEEGRMLAEHLASVTRTGLPLASGLKALAEELPERRLRRAIDRLARSLEMGESLEGALEQQGPWIPERLKELAVVGTKCNNLGELLGQYSNHINLGVELRRSLWMRLAYPITVVVLGTAIFSMVSLFLYQGLTQIFFDFGRPVPKLTRFLISAGAMIDRLWKPALGLGILLVMACGLYQWMSRGKLHRLAYRIPLLGSVWHHCDLAEFSRLLAVLLQNQVPLTSALSVAGDTVRNQRIARGALAVCDDVASGVSLSESLTRRELFPGGFFRLLKWAESNQALAEVFLLAGDLHEAWARRQACLARLIGGFLAGWFVAGGIFLIVLAGVLPLFQLIGWLSG